MDSSSLRHIAHLLAKLKFLFLSITSVGTLRLDAAQARKQAFIGAFDFQISFAEKSGQLCASRFSQRLLIEKIALESRDQIILSSQIG